MIVLEKKFFAIAAVMLCMTAALACSTQPVTTRQLAGDFTTEGFIDRDNFQVIVTGSPDKKSKGLVQSRESARKDAETKLESTVLKKLSDYALQSFFKRTSIDVSKINNYSALAETCTLKMRGYLSYASVAFEYYNEDRSAVLVIRVYKKNLIDELESFSTPIELNGEQHAQ